MSDRDWMQSADRDRLIEIWNSRVEEGANYDSKEKLEASVRLELLALALSLHAHNFLWPAQAIAGFLLGESKSLDAAFGLKRGKPLKKKTLNRDADVLQFFLFNRCSYLEMNRRTKMDRKDVRGICECREGYERRFNAAYVEIIARELAKHDPTDD